jgi:hypothetical protein
MMYYKVIDLFELYNFHINFIFIRFCLGSASSPKVL